MDAPPPIPPRPSGYELRGPVNPSLPPRPSPSGQQQFRQVPDVPPPPPRPHTIRQPMTWGPLSNLDGTATPLMMALLAAFFARLDSRGTGTITPETLSAFLDVHGFLGGDNVWKSNLAPNVMFQPEDLADFELKAACEAWSFEHRVAVRNPGRPQLPYGGMPMLTLQGFTDMMAVEHASDPELAWRGINAALRYYDVWRELGPLPRECLLPGTGPPIEVQRRIEQAGARARRTAAERIEANRVKHALQAQGRRNAEELAGDYYYVRRDYY
ncbi:hypothetical protein GL218_00026 [Daldinia childiae]|uniref:uncharacterized protein n=1 Tax=Daldinia childiae TaxID=326645 RepID=UPI0014467618|nr:uncharacterized protein GL218_00026 [Daldinia childiae]KAF3071196.1 hypothetical protein GL218_00026 [Daldinia childiae]